MPKLEEIEGIGDFYAERLREAGVRGIRQLLKAGSTPSGRQQLALTSGVRSELLLEWINHADLLRVKGVGPQFADLLEAAGVDTVPELARRNAFRLFLQLRAANAQQPMVRRLPSYAEVQDWVQAAKDLPRVIEY